MHIDLIDFVKFNLLAGALMCGVGCLAAVGYCVLDAIGSRKLDRNKTFNVKSAPIVSLHLSVVSFKFYYNIHFNHCPLLNVDSRSLLLENNLSLKVSSL